MKPIFLGYEVKTGEKVEIPVRHMIVTGQTQESGKTTTLEALIHRGENLRAIAFVTKRGEKSFKHGNTILPYFQERADWAFVSSILESMMREKMRFERAWITRACRGAETLIHVRMNCAKLEKESRKDMSKDVYMMLGEYLDRVLPLLACLPRSHKVDLRPGITVMDLSAYPLELQMLVISSTLEYIHARETDVVTIIPEAWQFVPQGRKTPVKLAVENLVRLGAGLKNYVWFDSQDIAGVEKTFLRACSVWLLGVQRESNEVKRTLANMHGLGKPKPEDVAGLHLGQFFVAERDSLRKVYVNPVWMDTQMARNIATGSVRILPGDEALIRAKPALPSPSSAARETPETFQSETGFNLPAILAKTDDEEKGEMRKQWTEAELFQAVYQSGEDTQLLQAWVRRILPIVNGLCDVPAVAAGSVNGAALVQGPESSPLLPEKDSFLEKTVLAVLDRIKRDPVLIKLSQERAVIEIAVTRKIVKVDGATVKGKLATMIHERFFQRPRSHKEIRQECIRRGMAPTTSTRFDEAVSDLVKDGFFYICPPDMYELVPGSEVRVVSQ